MTLGRRGFLGLMGSVPLSARALAEDAAAKLAAITTTGVGTSGPPGGGQPAMEQASPTEAQYQYALAHPSTRAQVEQLLYEGDCRYVYAIDPDLAVMRSLSLNAKVTFQRQRNVKRRMEEMEKGWAYNRLTKIVRGVLGF